MRSIAGGLAVVLFAVLAVFVLPYLPRQSLWPAIIIAMFVVVMAILVRRHALTTGYHCPACGHEFVIGTWTDFLSPHTIGCKMLRCPRCGEGSWCTEIERAAIVADPAAIPAGHTLPPVAPVVTLYVQVAVVLAVYALIWGYTTLAWPGPGTGFAAAALIRIPLVATVLPLLHTLFCLYGARQGYRSRIYVAITIFVAIFLLLALWVQWTFLSRLSPGNPLS